MRRRLWRFEGASFAIIGLFIAFQAPAAAEVRLYQPISPLPALAISTSAPSPTVIQGAEVKYLVNLTDKDTYELTNVIRTAIIDRDRNAGALVVEIRSCVPGWIFFDHSADANGQHAYELKGKAVSVVEDTNFVDEFVGLDGRAVTDIQYDPPQWTRQVVTVKVR